MIVLGILFGGAQVAMAFSGFSIPSTATGTADVDVFATFVCRSNLGIVRWPSGMPRLDSWPCRWTDQLGEHDDEREDLQERIGRGLTQDLPTGRKLSARHERRA
jgi:hypothetical protein